MSRNTVEQDLKALLKQELAVAGAYLWQQACQQQTVFSGHGIHGLTPIRPVCRTNQRVVLQFNQYQPCNRPHKCSEGEDKFLALQARMCPSAQIVAPEEARAAIGMRNVLAVDYPELSDIISEGAYSEEMQAVEQRAGREG